MTDAEAWVVGLERLYEWAVTARLTELNGTRPREWRGDGLHEWSYLWGAFDVLTPDWLREAMAAAPNQLDVSPKQLRAAAMADATDTFTERLLTSAHARRKETEETETEAGSPASVSEPKRKRPRKADSA